MMKAQQRTGYESEIVRYLQEHCIQPIQAFTGEQDISHIAVSCEVNYYRMLIVFLLAKGQESGQENLINSTFNKVSKHFTSKMGVSLPVPHVTMMAQGISPGLKIEGSIK